MKTTSDTGGFYLAGLKPAWDTLVDQLNSVGCSIWLCLWFLM